MIEKKDVLKRERKHINYHRREIAKHFIENVFSRRELNLEETINKILRAVEYVKSLDLNKKEKIKVYNEIKKYVFNMTRALAKRLNRKIKENKKIDKKIIEKVQIFLSILKKNPELRKRIEKSAILNNKTKIGLINEIKGFYSNIFYVLLPKTAIDLMDVIFYAKNKRVILKHRVLVDYILFTEEIKNFLKYGILDTPNFFMPNEKSGEIKQIFGNPLFAKKKRNIAITHETIHLILKELGIKGYQEEYLVEYLNQLLLLYTSKEINTKPKKGKIKKNSFSYANRDNPYLSARLSVYESWKTYLQYLPPKKRKQEIEKEIINNILWSM